MFREHGRVIRFWSTTQIRDALEKGEYIDAVVHTQFLVERVLIDLIVSEARDDRSQMLRRRKIDGWSGGSYHPLLTLYSLIEIAWLLGVITDQEHGELDSFRRVRNLVFHRHGNWSPDHDFQQRIEGTTRSALRFIQKYAQGL